MGATNVQIKWNKTTNVQDSTSIVLFLNECVERERQTMELEQRMEGNVTQMLI